MAPELGECGIALTQASMLAPLSTFGSASILRTDRRIFSIDWTGDQLMPAYYMMIACVIGLVALHHMPETARRSLRENPFAARADG